MKKVVKKIESGSSDLHEYDIYDTDSYQNAGQKVI